MDKSCGDPFDANDAPARNEFRPAARDAGAPPGMVVPSLVTTSPLRGHRRTDLVIIRLAGLRIRGRCHMGAAATKLQGYQCPIPTGFVVQILGRESPPPLPDGVANPSVAGAPGELGIFGGIPRRPRPAFLLCLLMRTRSAIR